MDDSILHVMEYFREIMAGLELALAEGHDYEAVFRWGAEEELPLGVPSSFMVPLEALPFVIEAMHEKFDALISFYGDLSVSLEQMRRGEGRVARTLAEELADDPDT